VYSVLLLLLSNGVLFHQFSSSQEIGWEDLTLWSNVYSFSERMNNEDRSLLIYLVCNINVIVPH